MQAQLLGALVSGRVCGCNPACPCTAAEVVRAPVGRKQVLARNPDIIITNVYGVGMVEEIISRPGWHTLDAVINNRVYWVDANASSRPSHNVISAIWEIARAVYPEYFN